MPSKASKCCCFPCEIRLSKGLVFLAVGLLQVTIGSAVLRSAENDDVPNWATWPSSSESRVSVASATEEAEVETSPLESIQAEPVPDWINDVAAADTVQSYYDPSNWYGYEDPFRVRGFAGENYSMRDTTGTFEVLKPLINELLSEVVFKRC